MTNKYMENEKLEFISMGEEGFVAFDADTGETHIFDETGALILSLLKEGKSPESIAVELNTKYEGDIEEIKKDISDFLLELIAKKIVKKVSAECITEDKL